MRYYLSIIVVTTSSIFKIVKVNLSKKMREILKLSIFFLLSTFFDAKFVDSYVVPSPIVTTQSGQVVGTTDNSFFSREYFSYRGIPYAEPPIGDLRFKVSTFRFKYLSFPRPKFTKNITY